jgi:hypothetical protein
MRDELVLKSLRPEIFVEETTSVVETFQNDVLRPILKYQHELILQLTQSDVLFQKQISQSITIMQKRATIKQFFLMQPNYKYFLVGQICGLMTSYEFQFYLNSRKEIDKRLTNMLTERILSFYC